jgi:hypothetical protein
MNLQELFNLGRDIRESDISKEWVESFNRYMWGKTCAIEHLEDGSCQFVYYWEDFKYWYLDNKSQIERDIKINTIL